MGCLDWMDQPPPPPRGPTLAAYRVAYWQAAHLWDAVPAPTREAIAACILGHGGMLDDCDDAFRAQDGPRLDEAWRALHVALQEAAGD